MPLKLGVHEDSTNRVNITRLLSYQTSKSCDELMSVGYSKLACSVQIALTVFLSAIDNVKSIEQASLFCTVDLKTERRFRTLLLALQVGSFLLPSTTTAARLSCPQADSLQLWNDDEALI